MKIAASHADYFTWGDACDGWWLKQGGKFSVVEERMPHGTAEKRYYHQE